MLIHSEFWQLRKGINLHNNIYQKSWEISPPHSHTPQHVQDAQKRNNEEAEDES